LSIWEVLEVEHGKSVTVRDQLSGEERQVHEVRGSTTLVERDAVLGRVVDHEGVSVFCGTHPRPLPPFEAAEVLRRARAKVRRQSAVPVEKLRRNSLGRFFIARWEETVDDLDARASIPPRLSNTDGDDLLLTADHFSFEPGTRADVEGRLRALEGSQPPEDGGEDCFTFLRTGNAIHKDWENTVNATAWLSGQSLRLETNSIARADELRRRVEEACRGLIRHRAREHRIRSQRPTARNRARPRTIFHPRLTNGWCKSSKSVTTLIGRTSPCPRSMEELRGRRRELAAGGPNSTCCCASSSTARGDCPWRSASTSKAFGSCSACRIDGRIQRLSPQRGDNLCSW
jgi:hypothetical protein